MILKAILYAVLLVSVLHAAPERFNIIGHKQELSKLMLKKQQAKRPVIFGTMFDDVADDTKKLLDTLDEDDQLNQEKKQDAIKMIVHNVQIMHKLLTFMKNDKSELRNDHYHNRSDVSACGVSCYRPAKRVLRPDLTECTSKKLKTTNDDDDENIQNKLH